MWSSFAYTEPSTASTLILLSYLFLLNVFGWLAQRILGAGLLGQILIGIIYGTPLAGWLDRGTEAALVRLGYVGLLLLVFEGGLSTSPHTLLALFPLSAGVALTGILFPIALSFILMPLSGSSGLHAFAAGASMSSTSLGTVLTLLNPTIIGFDLRRTRLGTVLLSAAVLDDVVALVLVKVLEVIGDAGAGTGGSAAIGGAVGRTVGVTIGLALLLGIITHTVLLPLYSAMQRHAHAWSGPSCAWGGLRLLLLLMGILFIGLVAAAGYAGTSVLFGAYIAGLSVAYMMEQGQMDSARQRGEKGLSKARSREAAEEEEIESEIVGHSSSTGQDTSERPKRILRAITLPAYPPPSSNLPPFAPSATNSTERLTPPSRTTAPTETAAETAHPQSYQLTPTHAFKRYITPLLTYLLLPLFFGSIGYSIPFVPLWRGAIVWRGIVYALLMALGKMACGIWVGFWPVTRAGEQKGRTSRVGVPGALPRTRGQGGSAEREEGCERGTTAEEHEAGLAWIGPGLSGSNDIAVSASNSTAAGSVQRPRERIEHPCSAHDWKSSWRAVVLLGMAMVARGEIGLLISQVAYHTREPLLTEAEFLQVIWAIVLCTIAGPVGISVAIKRWGQKVLEGGWE